MVASRAACGSSRRGPPDPRSRLSSWPASSSSSTRRQCGPPRGAGLVGDALCGLGQPQPARPCGRRRRRCGPAGRRRDSLRHQRRRGVGGQAQFGRGLAHRDAGSAADQPQEFGLGLGQSGADSGPRGSAHLTPEPAHGANSSAARSVRVSIPHITSVAEVIVAAARSIHPQRCCVTALRGQEWAP